MFDSKNSTDKMNEHLNAATFVNALIYNLLVTFKNVEVIIASI